MQQKARWFFDNPSLAAEASHMALARPRYMRAMQAEIWAVEAKSSLDALLVERPVCIARTWHSGKNLPYFNESESDGDGEVLMVKTRISMATFVTYAEMSSGKGPESMCFAWT